MRKKCVRILALVVFGLGLAVATAHAAPPVNMIVNGDFETGTFAGWTIVNQGSGAWALNNGAFVPPGPGGALPPISGVYDAVSYQTGPGFYALRQTITVPNGVFSARLSWNDRIRNWAGIYSDPNQEWRVVVRDVAGNLIQELYSTTPGDPLQQIGPTPRSADITALLQANAGSTLVVSFEEQDNLGFFNATLDDAQLLVSVLAVDKDECKDNGWQTFVNVNTGQKIFKNQGDCVSFIATKGKNLPRYQ